MLTAANITDRNGAVYMVDYYCKNTNYLSKVKKLLVDGGYTGDSFAVSIKATPHKKLLQNKEKSGKIKK